MKHFEPTAVLNPLQKNAPQYLRRTRAYTTCTAIQIWAIIITKGLTTLEGSIKNVLQFNPINLHINSGNTTEELDDVTGVVKGIITFYL
jgi:hypothetical protein